MFGVKTPVRCPQVGGLHDCIRHWDNLAGCRRRLMKQGLSTLDCRSVQCGKSYLGRKDKISSLYYSTLSDI